MEREVSGVSGEIQKRSGVSELLAAGMNFGGQALPGFLFPLAWHC